MHKNSDRPLVPFNIRDLQPYVAGKTIEEVKKEYNPSRISKLASNENRRGCSPLVAPAVEKAVKEIQDYPDPVSRELRSELAANIGVGKDNIMVAAGSESVIANICRTFFLNHEEAVTADATFVGFFVQANTRGISLKKIPLTSDYRFDIDAISRSVTGRTKMIYIANPNNPTGTYITGDEFESLMAEVPSDVLVIMDEAYFEYAGEVEDYPNSVEYGYKNVVTLRTFSKAYGLAGLRIGYAVGEKELIGNMMKTKLTFEPTAPAQSAALAALKDQEYLRESVRMVKEGRKRLYDFFDARDVFYIPSVSNSVMMIMESEQEAIDLTRSMLKKGVILRRTNAFGLPNCIRITIGTELDMEHFEKSFDECFSA